MIVVVCGSEGTGKTTVAKMIAEDIDDSLLLSTDSIRKELFKNPTHSNEEDQQVYEEMFFRVKKAHSPTIILDATFRRNSNLEKAKKLAVLKGTSFMIICVTCPNKMVERRIEMRRDPTNDFRLGINIKYQKRSDPITMDHIVIENTSSLEALREIVRSNVLPK